MNKFRKTLTVLLVIQVVCIVTAMVILRKTEDATDYSWAAAIPPLVLYSFSTFASLVVSLVYVVRVLLRKTAADRRVGALILGIVLLLIPFHRFGLLWGLSFLAG